MSIPNSNERIKIFKLSFYFKKKLSYANGINNKQWDQTQVCILDRLLLQMHAILCVET
jgi:hypothetical protein